MSIKEELKRWKNLRKSNNQNCRHDALAIRNTGSGKAVVECVSCNGIWEFPDDQNKK